MCTVENKTSFEQKPRGAQNPNEKTKCYSKETYANKIWVHRLTNCQSPLELTTLELQTKQFA